MTSLLCKPQDGPDFEIQADSVPAQGFNEFGNYCFSVQSKTACRLLVDEIELIQTDTNRQNTWEWRPGFYAGEVLAELFDWDGKSIAKYRLDVSPDPKKLGRIGYDAMVEAIRRFDPRLLVGSESAQSVIGTRGEITNLHLQYSRLRRFGQAFVDAITAVTVRPQTLLTRDRTWKTVHQVKRVDRQTILSIIRNPDSLALLANEGRSNSADSGSPMFNVAMSRDELDTPANRALLATLYDVIRRSRLLIESFTRIAADEVANPTRTALKPRLGRRLEVLRTLEAQLRRIVKRTPFKEVTRTEVTSAGLVVIAAHPLYARAFRAGWNILRPGIEHADEKEYLWTSPTWEIYERWCYLQTFQAVQLAFPGLEWERRYPSKSGDSILIRGEAAGIRVETHFQLRFPAFDMSDRQSFYSLSRERYPDIVVTCTSNSVRRFVVLDAKYRSTRESVLEAMESAHIYSDSLRWNDIAPALTLLLVPAAGGAPWLEQTAFWEKHDVGVKVCTAGTDLNELSTILKSALI